MYQVFSIDGLSTWIYVESDNKYISRAVIYILYTDVKHITYIGIFNTMDDINVPETFLLEGFDKNTVDKFIHEFCF